MAYRTTPVEVQATLLTNYRPGTDLIPFIRRANLFVSRVATCASTRKMPLAAGELQELEILIACHFYQAADPGYSSRTTEGAGGSFEGQTGSFLERTRYGQDAISLDPSGCVLSMSKAGTFAKAAWLGKRPSEQTDYIDRS